VAFVGFDRLHTVAGLGDDAQVRLLLRTNLPTTTLEF
jgi:hypothetical protein